MTWSGRTPSLSSTPLYIDWYVLNIFPSFVDINSRRSPDASMIAFVLQHEILIWEKGVSNLVYIRWRFDIEYYTKETDSFLFKMPVSEGTNHLRWLPDSKGLHNGFVFSQLPLKLSKPAFLLLEGVRLTRFVVPQTIHYARI